MFTHTARREVPESFRNRTGPSLRSLAYGVTTEHDPSNDTEEIFSASEMQKAGLITGPRLFSTGTILYGAEGNFKAVVNNLEDARSHLRRLKAVGAFTVKSYNQPRRDQRQQIIEAARELNMMVVPEGGSTYFWNISQILDGHTGIEHSLPVSPLYKDVSNALWAKPHRVHPHAHCELRRPLGRKLLVCKHTRLGKQPAANVRPALDRRCPLQATDRGQ